MDRITRLIQKHDLSGLKNYLSMHPGAINSENDQQLTPLILAAYHQFDEAVNLIASLKSELTLYEAILCGRLDVVRGFLDKDPSCLNSCSKDGFTPLGLSCFFGKREIAAFLLSENADPNQPSENVMKVAPLHSAAAGNHDQITELLLEHGADPDLSQQQGIRAIHTAAHNGKLNIVRLLIRHGAEINPADDNGKRAADYARESGHSEIYTILTKQTDE